LLKGGHLPDFRLVDVLMTSDKKIFRFYSRKIITNNTHGTGCSYASAIAAGIAKGYSLPKAVYIAHKYVFNAIKKSYKIGNGHSPINHFYKFW
jgi:hydroxymethylpyrimidine/phosphomethylpyrimidine kinase